MSVSASEQKIQAAVIAFREGTAKRWDFCEKAEAVVGTGIGNTLTLAGRIGKSRSQVENYARAWIGWITVDAVIKDPQSKMLAKQKLTISHWTTLTDLWKQYEFDLVYGWEKVEEIVKGNDIPNVLLFKELMLDHIGVESVPEWQSRWKSAVGMLRKAVDDYGIPEELRQRALFLLEAEPVSRIYTIEDYRVPSWNVLYEQRHWTKRKAIADEAHSLVRSVIDPEDCKLNVPVDILVVAHYKKRPADSDNPCAKILIDPLQGWVIPDDSYKSVRRVTTHSLLDKSDSVQIVVTEVQGATPWESE